MRKLTPVLALLALALPAGSAGAQTPVPAPPGSKAEGVEFLGNLPINGSVGANFKTYGDQTYMFVTGALGASKFDPGLAGGFSYGGLYVYDITTDPGNPKLVSHLPVPHYESEDVSIGGHRLLISGDGTQGGSNLVVVDISDPRLPKVESVINMSALGEGHTSTCIQDCRYVWAAGSNTIKVIDLDGKYDADVAHGTLPAISGQSKAVELGPMKKQREFGWAVHDVQVDDAGIAWVVGGNGTVAFDVNKAAYGAANALQPTVVARTGDYAIGSSGAEGVNTVNDFIHHNMWRPDASSFVPRAADDMGDSTVRPGEKVLITEEDIWSRTSGFTRGGCKYQGSFQTWHVKRIAPTNDLGATVAPLDQWTTEYNAAGRLPTDDYVDSQGFCSAHYFDAQKGSDLVSVAWYAQGTRLLDTSDPRDIKQVGYFMAPDSTVWAAYFAPTDKSVIYVMDHERGLDVLRIKKGGTVAKGQQVRAPYMKWWRGIGKGTKKVAVPHPVFGWVCQLTL
jgi:hypothetical protein